MLIKSTSVCIKYKKIDNVKKTYFKNEDMLKDQFNEATVLPIPDDAPVDVPRIIVKSLHEHSQLNITPIAANLQINYDAGFEKDWARCEEYINNKMKLVFNFMNIMTQNEYDYLGIVTDVFMDEYSENGAKILADNLLKVKPKSGIYDLNARYTFVEDQNIFVNIALQNVRIFKEGMSADMAGNLTLQNQVSETIGAVIDINDRFGFNCDINYKTSSSKLNDIIGKMTEVINTKLNILLTKGEY